MNNELKAKNTQKNNSEDNDSQIKKVLKGDKIKVKTDNGSIKEFIIVDPLEFDPAKGLISDLSPLGKTLLGATAGEKKTYQVGDKTFSVEILEINKLTNS